MKFSIFQLIKRIDVEFFCNFLYFSGGLSNFLYYVSLPDDIDTCNSVKNTKRARKDASLQEPKEVSISINF